MSVWGVLIVVASWFETNAVPVAIATHDHADKSPLVHRESDDIERRARAHLAWPSVREGGGEGAPTFSASPAV